MSHSHGQQSRELPLTVMGQGAFVRVAAVAVALALLWAAVAWAVALP